jgi:hypothetical protein
VIQAVVSGGSRRSEASAPDERTIMPAGNVVAVAPKFVTFYEITHGLKRR